MGDIWNGFVRVLEWVLTQCFVLSGNAGLAIIIFTVIVKIVLLPLTAGQLRSSREMQKLQPKIRELQKKYAKDRKKLSQETMALYKEHGVNPLSGCLPSLLQLPIFFGVYFAILNLCRIPSLSTLLGRAIGTDIGNFLHLGDMGALREGLQSGILANQPFLWMANLGKPDAWHVLPILAGVLQLIQQKMMSPRDGDPQQSAMNNAMMILPVVFVFIGWTFPAGPVLYWVTQSLVGIVQQYFTSGWGALANWLPFLPERKVAPSAKAKPKSTLPAGEETTRRGLFGRWMDRITSLPEEAAEQDGLKEGAETAESASTPPPMPSKRRSRK